MVKINVVKDNSFLVIHKTMTRNSNWEYSLRVECE